MRNKNLMGTFKYILLTSLKMTFVKEKDFVEISFVARIKESKQIFDLTDEEQAKKEGLYEKGHAHFGPKIICIGQGQVILGLDKTLVGKTVGESFSVDIKPEEAFGKKDLKLVKVIPTSVLLKQDIRPYPGLQIEAPGMTGTIRTVSSGRTTVDFNHPLAGKEVLYEVKILRIVHDDKEKIEGLLLSLLHLHKEECAVTIEDKNATLTFKNKIQEEAKEFLKSKMKELLPSLQLSFA